MVSGGYGEKQKDRNAENPCRCSWACIETSFAYMQINRSSKRIAFNIQETFTQQM